MPPGPTRPSPARQVQGYYVRLEQDKAERNAKLQSMKAAKERDELDQCTFRPTVNPLSTKIAYQQLDEIHLRDKAFGRQFLGESHDEPAGAIPTPLTDHNKNRLATRINKLLADHKQDKRERQDISTEQVEYERSKAELSFQPNTMKSKQSYRVVKNSSHKKSKGQRTPDGKPEQTGATGSSSAQPRLAIRGNDEAAPQDGLIEPVEEVDSEHEVQIDLNPEKGEVSYYGPTPGVTVPRNRLELQPPLDHAKVDAAPQQLEIDGNTNRESSHLRVDPYEQPISKHSSIEFQQRFLVTRLSRQSDSELTSQHLGASAGEHPSRLMEPSSAIPTQNPPQGFHIDRNSERHIKLQPFSPQESFNSGMSSHGNKAPKRRRSLLILSSEGSANGSPRI